MNYADMIIHGASIYPGLKMKENYNYIAVKDDVIISMGKGDLWKAYCDKKTEVLEYKKDDLVIPGFHDSHLHILMSSMGNEYVDLGGAKSEEDTVRSVKEFSETIPDEPWIIGTNWYHMNWENHDLPTKESIDRMIPDRPVFLINTEVHGAWVNSKALEIAGINKDTEDPPYGEIYRDSDGNATGFLNETAMGIVGKIALKFPPDTEKKLIKKMLDEYAKNGVTSVQDMRPELGFDLGQYDSFHSLAEEDELPVRVFSAANLLDDLDDVELCMKKYNADTHKVKFLKQYIDGVPTTHTAMVIDGYKDDPKDHGCPVSDHNVIRQQILSSHRRGLSVRLHCCGDGAVKTALDFIEEAVNLYGKTKSRHAVEHVEIIKNDDIHRMKRLEVIASMQPEHLVTQVEKYKDFAYKDLYTDEQLKNAWAIKTLLEEGITVAFGSDCPVVGIRPLDGIYRAVTRKFNDGEPIDGINPDERITVEEAIHCYTANSAICAGEETSIGILTPGMKADMVVLNKNILKTDPEDIRKADVLMTIMNGKITYRK